MLGQQCLAMKVNALVSGLGAIQLNSQSAQSIFVVLCRSGSGVNLTSRSENQFLWAQHRNETHIFPQPRKVLPLSSNALTDVSPPRAAIYHESGFHADSSQDFCSECVVLCDRDSVWIHEVIQPLFVTVEQNQRVSTGSHEHGHLVLEYRFSASA